MTTSIIIFLMNNLSCTISRRIMRAQNLNYYRKVIQMDHPKNSELIKYEMTISIIVITNGLNCTILRILFKEAIRYIK